MKKSKFVGLVLITSALASCNKPQADNWDNSNQKVYMRSDTTARYSHANYHNGGNAWLWYYAFRPYGYHNGGSYSHAGYYSNGISQNSNYGGNPVKSSGGGMTSRGGFGHSSFHVSS